jgi:hypothetical protein
MKSTQGKGILIAAAIMAALVSGTSFAQSTAPSSAEPSTPQQQPQTQPAQPQSPGQPQTPTEPQATPRTTQAPATAPSSNQAQSAATPRIAPGSVIPVELTKTLDAKKAKQGDPVLAKVTMDLKTNSGEVIVPKDTKVMGHVTEAQARSKEQKESQLGIVFDHAILESGDINLPMSIQAVIAPSSNDANSGSGAPGAPATGGGTASSPMGGGRNSAGGGGQTQPSSNTSPNAAPTTGTDAQQQGGARPQITGNTQGVVGISNLKLEAGQNATQGSVLSSEKNNVKVESGTMLLLKVTQ